jgi:Flp pilus assembly protein TadD
LDEALELFNQSLALGSNDPETHNRKGVVLVAKGRLYEGIESFFTAIRMAPNHAEAHRNLGAAFIQAGDFENALKHLRIHCQLNSNSAEIAGTLAWILATHPNPRFRNGNEAVQLALRAVDLTSGNDAGNLETLAAAYAEAGNFSNAQKTAQAGIEKARAAGDQPLVERLEIELNSYIANQPFRDPTFQEK